MGKISGGVSVQATKGQSVPVQVGPVPVLVQVGPVPVQANRMQPVPV